MRRSFALFVGLAFVAATAGCGSSGNPSPNAAGTSLDRPHGPSSTPSESTGTGAGTTPKTGNGATTVPGGTTKPGTPGGQSGTTPSGTPSRPSTGALDPSHVATEKELPITASVTPSCVIPGMTATLDVKTTPKASIAYVAVYNGEKSGATPPWGEGYGGNDYGEASSRGKWSNTWTVAANAPSGPARVMLVVGYNGKQRTVNVPFSVGEREVGGCGT